MARKNIVYTRKQFVVSDELANKLKENDSELDRIIYRSLKLGIEGFEIEYYEMAELLSHLAEVIWGQSDLDWQVWFRITGEGRIANVYVQRKYGVSMWFAGFYIKNEDGRFMAYPAENEESWKQYRG